MEINSSVSGLLMTGSTIKKLEIDNTIINTEPDDKRSIGMTILKPQYENIENGYFASLQIEFTININQEKKWCKFEILIEGAFQSTRDMDEEEFRKLVEINGAASLIGIARGKIESISATMLNNGKINIPYINVMDYYHSMKKKK